MRSALHHLAAAVLIVSGLLYPVPGTGTGPFAGGCPPWPTGAPFPSCLCPPDMTPVAAGCWTGDGTLLR
jgi:hypothetical protein